MEPIEREIVDVVLNWSLTWTDWPTADSTSLREEAVRLLIRAGMLERRITYSVVFAPPQKWWTRMRGVRSAEGFEFVVDVSGHDWSKRFETVLGKLFPPHWFNDDRLVGRADLHQTRSQVRLTDQGELARHEITSGFTGRVLDYVLGRGFYEWYPKTTSHVDIVSRSDPAPITLSATANAMAVASANANASVGNITTVINNGFDLSSIVRALGEIAAALDNGSPTQLEVKRGEPPKGSWVTAAELQTLTGVNRGVIHRAADEGKIETNGKDGRDKLFSFDSFHAWHKNRANREK